MDEWGHFTTYVPSDHYKDIGDEESYRDSRNRTVEIIKRAKTEYYTNVIKQTKSNSKMLWDYLRQIAPEDSKQLPSSVKDGETKLTDAQDIAKSRPSTSLVIGLNEITLGLIQCYVTFVNSWKKHIHESLYMFLIKHSLLYLAQSGFWAFHSCQTALTRLVDKWTSNMEEGLLNGIVLLDLRKAFDLVNTDILLQKLEIYNIDDNSLCWFKSHLQGRHQCVQFKGTMSETRPVTHGVPQGSILGPLLFIIFMNDLPVYVNSDFDMYADDSTLHAAAKTLDELELILNNDVECVSKWCKQNRMVANTDNFFNCLLLGPSTTSRGGVQLLNHFVR